MSLLEPSYKQLLEDLDRKFEQIFAGALARVKRLADAQLGGGSPGASAP